MRFLKFYSNKNKNNRIPFKQHHITVRKLSGIVLLLSLAVINQLISIQMIHNILCPTMVKQFLPPWSHKVTITKFCLPFVFSLLHYFTLHRQDAILDVKATETCYAFRNTLS